LWAALFFSWGGGEEDMKVTLEEGPSTSATSDRRLAAMALPGGSVTATDIITVHRGDTASALQNIITTQEDLK